MKRWPIERTWLVIQTDGSRHSVSTSELKKWRVCGMLGAAGLGKTFEQAYLAELERSNGIEVIQLRLAELGQTPEGLTSRLNALAARVAPDTAIFLDALDEVMVPVRTASLIVRGWVVEKLESTRPFLRLSCRSAVWPPGVQSAIESVYGEDACAFAVLQPLSEEDVIQVASARGLDTKRFLLALDTAGVRALSKQPLTLEMLLNIHEEHGSLPKRRRDLFRQGVEHLARERRERVQDGTAISLSTSQVLEVAERLACFCLLSGRDTIDLGESTSSTALAAREIEGLPGGDRPLDSTSLDAVCRSGLCDGDGLDRFRFAHRQFAEYLAGRRIAKLLPHQAQALLGTGDAWQSGVAGPLRETAAFAAMESVTIATWISDQDPEVVGLSDVADESLRRQATLNLLDKFRRHELTDSQTSRDQIELAGLRYAGAEKDLRPVLHERHDGCQDVIECAIELIESWGLASMSDDLATLMLDPRAPLQNRTSAGYALAKIGTPAARRRLLPLLAGGADDRDLDLKGLALQCNWPDRISVPELFDALRPSPRSIHLGPYEWFLHQLDSDRFNVRGYIPQGLAWARTSVRNGREHSMITNLIRRIANNALDELDIPSVAVALADLILVAAESHDSSPLEPPSDSAQEQNSVPPAPAILSTKPPEVRRRLIEALADRATKEQKLWWAAHHTPGLLTPEDFPWLVRRAVDPSLSMSQREKFAELATMLPWMDSAEAVEAWLNARKTEPIASRMPYPLLMELDSEEATKARNRHAEMKRSNRRQKPKRLRPPPHERVEQALVLSETKDPRFFINLCQELTLKDDSTHYSFSRFLVTTPGWTAASEATRTRIVDSAKRLLVAPSDEPDRAKTLPFNSILLGHMSAIWLVMAHDPDWIDARKTEWWRDWAWYILRELHPHMVGEPEDDKLEILRRLHARVPDEIRQNIRRLARSNEPETHDLLRSILGSLETIEDDTLDEQLCDDLEKGACPEDRVSEIAQFVLTRSGDRALSACLSCIQPDHVAARENCAVRAAIALLYERTREAWSTVLDLLRRRPDLASRVLGDFAHGERIRSRRADRQEPVGLAALSPGQAGQLVALLIETFPPETDPQYNGAHFMGPSDSARDLRNLSISQLGDQKSIEAVEALRSLERVYGAKYPWLRRPRARAERAYRLSRWDPVPSSVVAEILAAQNKRLIRSGADALDGIIAAVEEYQHRLKHESPSELEDLWNQTKGKAPTPKEEERVSDKVCVAVRRYFREFAVAASRETQVFRRKSPRALGGAPGSEVDVLCEVPAAGTAIDAPIKIPIEVKLAHNPDARSGLRDQLVERYMSELGAEFGLYVVVWMGKGGAGSRSLWKSREEAKIELDNQISELNAAPDVQRDIRCIVIDASLPLAKERKKSNNRGAKRDSGRCKTANGQRSESKRRRSSIRKTRRPVARRRKKK